MLLEALCHSGRFHVALNSSACFVVCRGSWAYRGCPPTLLASVRFNRISQVQSTPLRKGFLQASPKAKAVRRRGSCVWVAACISVELDSPGFHRMPIAQWLFSQKKAQGLDSKPGLLRAWFHYLPTDSGKSFLEPARLASTLRL